MAISEQEQKDLDVAKAKVEEIKLDTFELMRGYLSMGENELRHSGHKTIEGALLSSMTRVEKEIKGIWKAHIKKYPD